MEEVSCRYKHTRLMRQRVPVCYALSSVFFFAVFSCFNFLWPFLARKAGQSLSVRIDTLFERKSFSESENFAMARSVFIGGIFQAIGEICTYP